MRQAVRHLTSVDLSRGIYHGRHFLAGQAMGLRLQFELQLAEVGGSCSQAPSSAGRGLVASDTLVDRVVSDRVHSIMRWTV